MQFLVNKMMSVIIGAFLNKTILSNGYNYNKKYIIVKWIYFHFDSESKMNS